MRALTRPAAVGAATLLLVGLSGCSALLGPSEPERDAETGEVTEASDADVFALRVGDCMNSADAGDEVSSMPTVPCSEPHDSEIYASTVLEEGEYPGDESISETAGTYCEAEFATFVGLSYPESEIYATWLVPSQDGWERLDDREVLCVLLDEEGDVTGSMKGAQR